MNFNKKKIYSVKGTKDYLPKESYIWNFLYKKIENIILSYGYNYIILPTIEKTELFNRSIGEHEYIINKEMYSFKDKNGNSISLRPEGTSCCVRLGIENGLFRGNKHKLWYFGQMFRYEKPQLYRYREFYQLGIEALGFIDINIELELFLLINRIFKELKLNDYILLEINWIGSIENRNKYSEYLFNFFKKNIKYLDKISLLQLNTNPMRILDTKNEKLKLFIKNNVITIDKYIDSNYILNFNELKKLLKYHNINYQINPFLVRGLDYYNNTVFEWTTNKLSNFKSTICAGGRYDYLVSNLGGIYTPSIGLSIGWNRLVQLFMKFNNNLYSKTDITIICKYNINLNYAMKLSEEIRNIFKNIVINIEYSNTVLKKKIKNSIKYNSLLLIIIDDILIKEEKIILKNLFTYKSYIDYKNNIFALISKILY